MSRKGKVHAFWHLSFCAALLLASRAQVQASPKHAISPEDVVAIRHASDANISPDGKHILFVVTEPADPNTPETSPDDNIWIVPADGSQPARPFISTPKSETFPRWSPDGRRVAFLSDRGVDGQSQIWLVGADGGGAEMLTEAKAGVSSFRWSPDGRMIAYLARDEASQEQRKKQQSHNDAVEVDHDYRFNRLWVVAVNDRKPALVTRQDFEVREFDWSPDGESFAIASTPTPRLFEDMHCSLAIVRRSDGQLVRTLADDLNINFSQNVRWSPDGLSVLFFEAAPTRGAYWLSLIGADGGPTKSLAKDYPGTFSWAEWAPDSKHVIAGAFVDSGIKLLRLDIESTQIDQLADIFSAGADFSFSADARTFAFISETSDSPAEVWSQAAGQAPLRLTKLNPQVDSWQLGTVREITWTNRRDKQLLHGVLVTPSDFKSGQTYPTIVEGHPGNTAWQAGWQASWWQWGQLLASKGYVVFFPNPRGVVGRGWKFAELSQNYEDVAYEDAMDGLDFLVSQKIADPSRLGIGGWSNGGYLTTRAITRTTRFKAAVAFAAPVDFPLMWGASPLRVYFDQVYGPEPAHEQEYQARSPLHFVQACKTPTLILHGENDVIVPVAQAFEFYHALQSLGVETELVIYPREGHYISDRAHQVDFQKRALTWFDKHLR